MLKLFIVVSFLSVFILGCTEADPDVSDEETGDHEVTDENDSTPDIEPEESDDPDEQTDDVVFEEPNVLAENLNIPWSITHADEGFFITERRGTIVYIQDGELTRQEVELDEALSDAGEAGLLGLALDPQFTDNNRAYAYYTYDESGGPVNRIVTLQLDDNVWQETAVLLDDIPGGRVHQGGRLKLGPDDFLYVTTGDAAIPEIAQDIDSLGGKILRLGLDGSIPEDNPDPDSYVYSYGHRNAQGLTFSSDHTLYASEHGDQANDEVNLIESGQNYGWPVIEGDEEQDGMVTPLFTSGHEETWAPSGMAYYEGTLYVAGLRGRAIYAFDLESGDYQEKITGYGRIRDVFIQDQQLYFITNNTDGRGDPDETDDKLYQVTLNQ